RRVDHAQAEGLGPGRPPRHAAGVGIEAQDHLGAPCRHGGGEAIAERRRRAHRSSARIAGSVRVESSVVTTIAPAIRSGRSRYLLPITSESIAVGMAAISTTVCIVPPPKPNAVATPSPTRAPRTSR